MWKYNGKIMTNTVILHQQCPEFLRGERKNTKLLPIDLLWNIWIHPLWWGFYENVNEILFLWHSFKERSYFPSKVPRFSKMTTQQGSKHMLVKKQVFSAVKLCILGSSNRTWCKCTGRSPTKNWAFPWLRLCLWGFWVGAAVINPFLV